MSGVNKIVGIIFLSGVLLLGDEWDIVRGKGVYLSNCSGCHGVVGDGNGAAARNLNPKPRDFTEGKYRFRTTPSGYLPTDENITKIVRQGVRRTSMPAWEGILSDKDIREVVEYIKTFDEDFQSDTANVEIVIPENIPSKSEKLVQDGEMVYRISGCYNCHGSHGWANGPSSKKLLDSKGNKISAPDFRRDPFKGGDDPANVYRTFSTGLTGTPMPQYDDEVFGFYREAVIIDDNAYKNLYSTKEIEKLKAWANELITEEELNNLSEEEKSNLFRERKWALVYYVLSHKEKEGIFQKLFRKDYELTR